MDISKIDPNFKPATVGDLAVEYADVLTAGGEFRLSNFLLWELAYTELYVTDTLWPDFDADTLGKALEFYAGRDRRFGNVK